MTDLEILQAYDKAIRELNSLDRDPDEFDNFQHLDIIIPPSTKIKEYKWNSENSITAQREYPFSVLQHVTTKIKKQIAYRKSKLSGVSCETQNSDEK